MGFSSHCVLEAWGWADVNDDDATAVLSETTYEQAEDS